MYFSCVDVVKGPRTTIVRSEKLLFKSGTPTEGQDVNVTPVQPRGIARNFRCVTSRKEADVVQEGVVDHEGVQGIQASVVHCGHQDVLVTLAAQHKLHVVPLASWG